MIRIVLYSGLECPFSSNPVDKRFDGKGHGKLWYVGTCGSGSEMGQHMGVNGWSSGSRFFREGSPGACESF